MGPQLAQHVIYQLILIKSEVILLLVISPPVTTHCDGTDLHTRLMTKVGVHRSPISRQKPFFKMEPWALWLLLDLGTVAFCISWWLLLWLYKKKRETVASDNV